MHLRNLIRSHPAPEGLTGQGNYLQSKLHIHSSPIKEFRKTFLSA